LAKRLYRSRKDCVIAGICGGIAEYFDIDPILVRIIAVLTIFLNGLGLIAYIIAWIFIPQNPEPLGKLWPLILVIIGLAVMAGSLGGKKEK